MAFAIQSLPSTEHPNLDVWRMFLHAAVQLFWWQQLRLVGRVFRRGVTLRARTARSDIKGSRIWTLQTVGQHFISCNGALASKTLASKWLKVIFTRSIHTLCCRRKSILLRWENASPLNPRNESSINPQQRDGDFPVHFDGPQSYLGLGELLVPALKRSVVFDFKRGRHGVSRWSGLRRLLWLTIRRSRKACWC